MKELSLFTGAGGGLLGTKLLGWTSIGYVEFNDYCQKILKQRIKDGILDEAPIFSDIRTFNSEGYARAYSGLVDVLTAGFPCQPFSVAGKQQGADDERNMWPETIRTIGIVKPKYCLLENTPNLLRDYFGRILSDLAKAGYDAKWCVLGADDVGANHQRKRIWILAYTNKNRCIRAIKKTIKYEKIPPWGPSFTTIPLTPDKFCKTVGNDTDLPRLNGMAYAVDEIEAIGNGQVPAVVKAVWELLTQNE